MGFFESLMAGFFGDKEEHRNYAGVEDVEYEDLSIVEEKEEKFEDWTNGNPKASRSEWNAEKCLQDLQRGAN